MAESESVIEEAPLPEEDDQGLPGCPFWMVTFGDVVSLLMTFFVLILSFTELSPSVIGKIEFTGGKGGGDEFSAVTGVGGDGAISASDVGASGSGEQQSKFEYMEKEVSLKALDLEGDNESKIKYSMDEVSTYLSSESNAVSKDAIHVKKSQSGGGFKLAIDQKFAFTIGSARFKSDNKDHLDRIAQFIADLPNDIIISGFSRDCNRIAYPLFPSNAHLSIARCNALAEFLVNAWHVDRERIGIEVMPGTSGSKQSLVSNGSVAADLTVEVVSEFEGFARKELKGYDTDK